MSAVDPGLLELSFEYLVARDTLKWITITSDQVISSALSLPCFLCFSLSLVCPSQSINERMPNTGEISWCKNSD